MSLIELGWLTLGWNGGLYTMDGMTTRWRLAQLHGRSFSWYSRTLQLQTFVLCANRGTWLLHENDPRQILLKVLSKRPQWAILEWSQYSDRLSTTKELVITSVKEIYQEIFWEPLLVELSWIGNILLPRTYVVCELKLMVTRVESLKDPHEQRPSTRIVPFRVHLRCY
jgi:hypothetical protein